MRNTEKYVIESGSKSGAGKQGELLLIAKREPLLMYSQSDNYSERNGGDQSDRSCNSSFSSYKDYDGGDMGDHHLTHNHAHTKH